MWKDKLKPIYSSMVNSKLFWIFILVMIIGAYLYHTSISKMPIPESKEFYNCTELARKEFISFWSSYEKNKPDVYSVRDVNNKYQLQKNDCYEKYHSYFLLFGSTMTDDQIFEKIKELEAHTTVEAERVFESLSPEIQPQFYKKVFDLQ